MADWNGIRVMPNPLATVPAWKVERHPIRKRRRNWRPVKHQIPGALRLGDGTLIVHPSIYEQLKAKYGHA